MCLKSAVLSKFSNKSHRVQNLETDGIQEVSGSIPFISTKRKALKLNSFGAFYFCVRLENTYFLTLLLTLE